MSDKTITHDQAREALKECPLWMTRTRTTLAGYITEREAAEAESAQEVERLTATLARVTAERDAAQTSLAMLGASARNCAVLALTTMRHDHACECVRCGMCRDVLKQFTEPAAEDEHDEG